MSRPECGTQSGYRYHQKYDRYPCVTCSAAHKHNENAYRIRTGKNRAVRVPVSLLGLLLATVDASTLRRVEASLGEPVTAACIEAATGDAD